MEVFMNNLTCVDIKNEFLANKKVYCSSDSVDFYNDCLIKFFEWLDVENYCLDSSEVFNLAVFENYMLYLRSLGIKNTSVNTYMRGVKAFSSFMYQKGYIEKNYAMCIKSLKSDKEEKIPLSSDEVRRIDSCFDLNNDISLRNYLMFHLMLDCGLRRNEVVNLKKRDLNFDLGYISFIGKGSKKRVVPLPADLIDYFKLYFSHLPVYSDFAFLKDDNEPITKTTIKMMFQRLKVESGVVRLSAHLLRHTFATSFIAYGGNLEFLRLLMGHSSYNVTLNYLHISQVSVLLGIDVYKIDDCFFNFLQKKRSLTYKAS